MTIFPTLIVIVYLAQYITTVLFLTILIMQLSIHFGRMSGDFIKTRVRHAHISLHGTPLHLQTSMILSAPHRSNHCHPKASLGQAQRHGPLPLPPTWGCPLVHGNMRATPGRQQGTNESKFNKSKVTVLFVCLGVK